MEEMASIIKTWVNNDLNALLSFANIQLERNKYCSEEMGNSVYP
jgi:hypothetical protein